MSGGLRAEAFVLELGRGLHRHGYPAHRLEDALIAVSHRLGIEGQFFSTPTALFASFGPALDQRTFQVRVEPGSQNLSKLTDLDQVAAQVAHGELTPAQGSVRLGAIESAPGPYGPRLTTLCFALSSAAATRFLGGGLGEIATSFGLGLVTGVLALATGRWPAISRVFEPLAAALAAGLATLVAHYFPVSVQVATLGGLIILMPGFTLTVALTELATQNLMSGTARLTGAAGTFLLIGFGVALGNRMAERLVGEPQQSALQAMPEWTLLLALLVAPLTFTVLLKAHARDAGYIVAAGVLAFAGAWVGSEWLGSELGAFVGALVVGVASNVYARVTGRPPGVTIVPGILLLVPGSLGFRSLSSLLDRQTVLGVEAAFRTSLVAVSLATGLLLSNVLVAPPSLRARVRPLAPS